MITPRFELQQDDNFLIVKIHAKYAKVSETEIFFDGTDFKFYSKPYYLRLFLPGSVQSMETAKASTGKYDVDKGTMTIHMPKLNPGEMFEGLDLISKLTAIPKPVKQAVPCIEVISINSDSSIDSNNNDEEFSWFINQHAFPEEFVDDSLTSKYGFGNLKSGVLSRFEAEIPDITDVRDPDTKTREQRHEERLKKEKQDFSEDHYLADLFDSDDGFDSLLRYDPPWQKVHCQFQRNPSLNLDETIVFTKMEKEKLQNLPRKDHLLNDYQKLISGLGLVDIIFAYAYQHRTTEGENNCESGWTIAKISPTLSWLDTHASPHEAIRGCMRRSLCYPLYRHWKLIQTVLDDTKHIFALGRKQLLKCMLEIHSIFTDCDSRYLLNDLYITDYCVWLQNVSKNRLTSLSEEVQKVVINKEDVGLGLEGLESTGVMVQKDDDNDEAEKLPQNSGTEQQSDSASVYSALCENLDNLTLYASDTLGESIFSDAEFSSSACASDDSGEYYLDSDDVSSETEE